ncbi:MAG: DEP domain-containing protein [Halothece sp.]
MLLLSANQVQYCQVARKDQTGKVEVIPGIAYYGKFFVRGEIFSLSQKNRAIAYSRQRFSEYQEQVYILLVEEKDRLTLWYENSEVTPLSSENNQYFTDFISTIDLNQLVFKMRSKEGVKRTNRRRGFRTFRKCFSGREAVNWLQQYLQISREDAIRLGERLLNHNLLSPLTINVKSFQDRELLYRFTADE